VQSLAMQTARHADDLADFSKRFEKRLLGLARAHDLLTKRNWEDAPLDFLAREVVCPLAIGSHERVQIQGPPVPLNPRAALSLTMALNELATNAAKYGALSCDQGELSLVWQVLEGSDHTLLELVWQERGGPPVEAPARRGFGTRFIERCIERDLGGEVDLLFERPGVCCRLSIPLKGRPVNG
jgi:two-component sensor histidine kinase